MAKSKTFVQQTTVYAQPPLYEVFCSERGPVAVEIPVQEAMNVALRHVEGCQGCRLDPDASAQIGQAIQSIRVEGD